jgi:hypothetical protein
MSNLSQTLVRLVIQQVNLSKKEVELEENLATAQNLKDEAAIDEIGAEYDKLEENIIATAAAESNVIDYLLEESHIDFYQN